MTLRKELPPLWTSMNTYFKLGCAWKRSMVLLPRDPQVLQQWILPAYTIRRASTQLWFKNAVLDGLQAPFQSTSLWIHCFCKETCKIPAQYPKPPGKKKKKERDGNTVNHMICPVKLYASRKEKDISRITEDSIFSYRSHFSSKDRVSSPPPNSWETLQRGWCIRVTKVVGDNSYSLLAILPTGKSLDISVFNFLIYQLG